MRHARKVRCPILVVIAERDTIAPPAAVRTVAREAPQAESISFDCGHFDIYTGEVFEKSVAAQVDFLLRTLRTAQLDPAT